MAGPARLKLLIVLPALDEEVSIDGVIERTLAARDAIVASSPVTEVAVTVVSDGSTDRTVERARAHVPDVGLVVFEQWRGYGAAIKEAWSRSDADLLGFMDADGTCDPLFFAPLCSALEADGADVAVGCRMTAETGMPRGRRLANTALARMLTAFSSTPVHDAASGMRVVRATSLRKLMPLPDGLHFTPAMSARAILDEGLRLTEVDMPYREREGRSKLHMGRDGLRFLRVVLRAVSLYRPSRLLTPVAVAVLAVAAALMVQPTLFYLRTGTLEEVMIYRLVVSEAASIAGCLLLCAGYLTSRIVAITLSEPSEPAAGSRTGLLRRLFRSRWFWAVPLLLVAASVALVAQSFLDRITTGATYEHWSHFVVMSLLVSVALILTVTRIIDRFLDLVGERLRWLRSAEPDDGRPPAPGPTVGPSAPARARTVSAGAAGVRPTGRP